MQKPFSNVVLKRQRKHHHCVGCGPKCLIVLRLIAVTLRHLSAQPSDTPPPPLTVTGTQTEIDACLKMIREKFPVNKFPAMTLEQLNRPTEQSLAVPESQQVPSRLGC